MFRYIYKIKQDGYVEQFRVFLKNWSEIDCLENAMSENFMRYCIHKRIEPTVSAQELCIVGREWMGLHCAWD